MKKYSWIVALLLALSLAFFACDNGGKDDDDDVVDPTLQDLVIDGADIVLKHCGNSGLASHVNGNQFILADQGSLDNVGFYWEFPAEVKGKGYGAINVEMEVISIDSPDFIGFMTHSSSAFGAPVKVIDKKTGQQKTGEYDHEFKLGVECEKGAAGDTAEGGDGILDGSSAAGVKHDDSYPFAKFNDRIAFQVNQYAGNITNASAWDKKATFTIAVTKVTFVGGAVPDSVVDLKAIPGIIVPATGLVPVTTVESNSQYTGAVTWAGTLDGDGKFKLGEVYTATITLTAKEGFTLTGVAANFFTVDGAETVSNAANSGVVTAVFPAAENPPAEVILFDLAEWLKTNTTIGTPLQNAGSPTITVTSTGITVSNRSSDWNAFDIVVSNFTFDYDTYDYTLTLAGSSATANGVLKAGQSGDPYGEVGRVTAEEADTVYTFTGNVPEKGSDDAAFGNIRIQTTSTQDYTITSLILKGVEK